MGTLAIVAGPATGSSHRLRFRSVAVHPGHSALTRTPSAAHSTASDLVSEISPAFAAPYGVISGDDATPATDATLITEPLPRSSRWPANAWQTYTAEVRLSLISLSQPERRRSRKGTIKFEPPALFTTMSTWPSPSTAAATASATLTWSVTSAGITSALRPAAVTSSAVFASPS